MSNDFDDILKKPVETIDTEFVPVPDEAEETPADDNKSAAPNKGGGLSSLLDRIPKFDMDTILLILIVFFLLSDKEEGENKEGGIMGMLGDNTDLLLIVGLLFILGF